MTSDSLMASAICSFSRGIDEWAGPWLEDPVSGRELLSSSFCPEQEL